VTKKEFPLSFLETVLQKEAVMDLTKSGSSLVKVLIAVLVLAGTYLTLVPSTVVMAEEPYYKGKTIRFNVGFSPGGGHDTYTRLMAKYLGKHIPGNPRVIVQNMLGGGSLISANYMYQISKPDGLTIGRWASGLIRQQVLGRREIKFDARKFGWVGAPTQDHLVCAIAKASGFTSWEQVMETTPDKPLIIGGMVPGASLSDDPRLVQAAMNFPMKLVEGYKGSADVRRATEGGEVHGGCWGWASVKVTWKDALEAGIIQVLLQAMPTKHPDLLQVPTSFEFVRSEEARTLLKVAANGASLLRSYSMPPGTPKELRAIIQKGFMDMMKDKDFLATAERTGLQIDPLSGQEVEQLVRDLFKMPPEVKKKLRRLLLPKS
jgi:tripartite-type tricarboxylate transporter receptor subunit TctC